jgi:hypothetical protein
MIAFGVQIKKTSVACFGKQTKKELKNKITKFWIIGPMNNM